MKLTLSPRDKVIAVVVGLLLVVVLLVVFLVVPQFKQISAVQAQIATAEQESQAATALLQQRRAIKDQAAVTDNSMVLLANSVPENPELPSLIIELQDAAYDSEVVLSDVSPAAPAIPENNPGWIEVPIEVHISGTWENTVDYLETLRGLTRELRINSFTTTPLSHDTAVQLGLDPKLWYYVQTDVTITSYVIPAPATAPAQ